LKARAFLLQPPLQGASAHAKRASHVLE
jgi:hypothetical protein